MEGHAQQVFKVIIDNRTDSRNFALRVAEASPALRPSVYPLNEADLKMIVENGYYDFLAEALRLEKLQGRWLTITSLLKLVKAGREDLADQCLAIPGLDFLTQHNWVRFSIDYPEELNEKTIKWIEKHFDVEQQFQEAVSDDPHDKWEAVEGYFESPDYDPYVGAWLTSMTGLGLTTSLLDYAPPSALGLERMSAAEALDFSLEDLWDAGIKDLIRSGAADCRGVHDLAQGLAQDTPLAEAVKRMRLIIRARGKRYHTGFKEIARRLNCKLSTDRIDLQSLLFGKNPPK